MLRKKLQLSRNIQQEVKESTIPPFEAELLLAFLFSTSREHIIAHPEKKVSFLTHLRFQYLVHQRKHDVPLAYLTKVKEFYGLSFRVSKNTLVPRPETEYLVEEAVKELNITQHPLLLDIGTGTGCIPIAIISHTKVLPCIAIDISSKALSIAQENFNTHKIEGCLIQSNLFSSPLLREKIQRHAGTIFITANLPYVPLNDWKNERSISREPKIALVSGVDGLTLYRRFINELHTLSIFKQRSFTVICEMLVSQEKDFLRIVQTLLPESTTHTIYDSCARIAFIIIRQQVPLVLK